MFTEEYYPSGYFPRTVTDGGADCVSVYPSIASPDQFKQIGIGENLSVNYGRDPFNLHFRKFQSKTEWIGSII